MSSQPTLIILATPAATVAGLGPVDDALRPALPDFQHIAQTLDQALDAELPVVLAASRWVRQQCEVFAPEITCVETDVLNPPGVPGQDWARAVSLAVQVCPQSAGWLVMPTPMPRIHIDTLKAMADALQSTSLVCPSYRMQTGYPLGFSAEFFSELVRLQTVADLRRLLSRYPQTTLSVDDPGIAPTLEAPLVSGMPIEKSGDGPRY